MGPMGGVAQSLARARLDKSPSEDVYWMSMRRGGESVGARIAARIVRRLRHRTIRRGRS
jgi:hypothetical protein